MSGRFIGEVERGEKSISVENLYKLSVTLEVPLSQLTDVQRQRRSVGSSPDTQRIFALISGRHPPGAMRRAYEMLRAMLD